MSAKRLFGANTKYAIAHPDTAENNINGNNGATGVVVLKKSKEKEIVFKNKRYFDKRRY